MAAPRPPVFVEPDLLIGPREHPHRRPGPVEAPTPAAPPGAPVAAVAPAAPDAIDLRSQAHPLEVVETGSFARARCGCGWAGPARRSRAVATADGDRHPAAP
ncbi:MAG: hypothetical protein M3P23_13835 [Actinomycetota bacterium]|nr:hypothetical protein [Actinomycetota bacterium]